MAVDDDTKLNTVLTVQQLADISLVVKSCRMLMTPVKHKDCGRELNRALDSVERIGEEWRTVK